MVVFLNVKNISLTFTMILLWNVWCCTRAKRRSVMARGLKTMARREKQGSKRKNVYLSILEERKDESAV
jgi:hypothetical protein